jgi:hypothetical protein
MRRLVLALAASLSLTAATSLTVFGEPPDAAGSSSSGWTVYDYNASGRALAPRESASSMPATTASDGTTSFDFLPNTFTALLTTRDSALTGDLSGKTLTDRVSVSGSAAGFQAQNGDGCVYPANVRFYFTAPSASGSSVGTPPAGFYTGFWWSNPANVPLLTGNQPPVSISAMMNDPSEWSDWNGKPASNPAVTEAFVEATQNVQSVGVSFGGGCFFENGVTTADGNPETFSSQFSES